jgi:uncharacterized protein YqjF (DUF2071 family)
LHAFVSRGLQIAAGAAEHGLRALTPEAPWLAQSAGLRELSHRPWPVPQRPWLLGQTWERLLFAHWRVEPQRLRALVPGALPLDTHDGAAWVSLTPFEVTGFRLHGLPPAPLGASFPELNLRTYVTVGGRPGIYFFSLDAGKRAAVWAARLSYRLPYKHARMMVHTHGERTRYASRRDDGSAAFRAEYGPGGSAFAATRGSLEHFLTERYCLYVVDRGRVLRADIHHPPWPLRPATAELAGNGLALCQGVELPPDPPLLHYSRRQDVVIWSPTRID